VDSSGTPITAPSRYLSGNPALQDITQISGTESNGNMRYDALQANLQKRFSQGLQFNVAYTYSKCMTDSTGYYGAWGQTARRVATGRTCMTGVRSGGPAITTLRTCSQVMPFTSCPSGGAGSLAAAGIACSMGGGNWQVSGILQLRGGFPLTIIADDASGTGSLGSRAIAPARPGLWIEPECSGRRTPVV